MRRNALGEAQLFPMGLPLPLTAGEAGEASREIFPNFHLLLRRAGVADSSKKRDWRLPWEANTRSVPLTWQRGKVYYYP
jgi:hypothetical protein